ncbi:hypothetical protein C5L30_002266 [Companilactobacillus farciminis]|jgi:hypothetical protein|uniref:DUF2089 domain-containing protein n=1 Tax=Companilactobacillus farciminis TaxID=1612 RepID=A0A4R5NDP0_9LACO|nr:DUF2089 family protein [Companilactobacillus farciminis]ATO45778.1 hypothetical protein LF20184_02950 [Companilactobacillus farciminis KCTC 3681 = DSM 20184]KRK62407.1 hypothetical protein FC68_GL002209 [Companilactobacillus farciminis KCTC 3681 = DSM 20184]TDG71686.1 hypothetical protein C5L30_002266 [Companilactobacillus farciminis]WCG36080.1 DUF2089 family protein [Companilactobacillus farciminis]
MNWFINLEPEDQEFIKEFVLASGSLKQLAKNYGVSYPTVRLRVDKLIGQIKLSDQNKDSFEVSIMQMVVDKQLEFDVAKKIIEKYEDSKNE